MLVEYLFHRMDAPPDMSYYVLLAHVNQRNYFLFGAGKIIIDPYVNILVLLFNFISSSYHLYYRKIQYFLWKCRFCI